MVPLTNEHFNSKERSIVAKLEIYLDGPTNAPLVVDHTDYLMSLRLLEEASLESENPIGEIVANSLSFMLYNDGQFTPTNTSGMYYGKIKTNVMVKPYFSVEDPNVEYVSMGVFFVDKWESKVSTRVASITCSDRLRKLLPMPMPPIHVMHEETYKNFYSRIFSSLGLSSAEYTVDSSLTSLLKYSYNLAGAARNTLQLLSEASLSYVTVDRQGIIKVIPLSGSGATVETLTDSNQIIKADIPQSILKSFSSVSLTYSRPMVSDDVELINLSDVSVLNGVNTLRNYSVSNGPVYDYSYHSLEYSDTSLITDITATSWNVDITLDNTSSTPDTVNITVVGKYIETNQTTETVYNENVIGDMGDVPLLLENAYIQDSVYASRYLSTMKEFISSDMPIVGLQTRGNPLLKLGDVVMVDDVTDGVNCKAKIVRAEYDYNGSLSCYYTLLTIGG